jgi:hypothetical protein
MKFNNLTRVLLVVSMVCLISLGPAATALLGVTAQSCPIGPCGSSTCDTSCDEPPAPCDGCVTVSPCTMADTGWALQIRTDSPTCPSTGSFAFQAGPGCPTAGSGSAAFTVGPDGNSDVQLRNSNFNGTKLSDLTALSYCTYVQFRNPGTFVAPYIGLTISSNGDNVIDQVLYFEPVYQTGLYGTDPPGQDIPPQDDGSVQTCQWKCWNALAGGWWLGTVGGPPLTTIASYVETHPNATIVNPDPCRGGIRLAAGEGAGAWDCFVGNADRFTIAVGGAEPTSVTYNFEPANCPIPTCGASPATAITACKYYDTNANGIKDPQDPPLDNWPITISPLGSAIPQQATLLTIDGCVSWGNLDTALNPYTVTEGTPIQSNWVHSTPTSVSVNVVSGQTSAVDFGNYCTAGSGGLTIGFWSNKNGQALITNSDLALLRSCNLVDAKGDPFNPVTKGELKSWLQKAGATNMAYTLSAQLAAMKLNVAHGFVDPTVFALCYNGTIAQLISAADAALAADGFTPTGDPNRALQETLKNCLDSLNNGGSVVSPTPCPATFASQSAQTLGVSSRMRLVAGSSRNVKVMFPVRLSQSKTGNNSIIAKL